MNTNCQNPTCTRDASETYHDEHGNGVEVCEYHYYQIVTGKSVGTAALCSPSGAQASVAATPPGETIGGARREFPTDRSQDPGIGNPTPDDDIPDNDDP